MSAKSEDPLQRILKHLDESAAPADQAGASATIAILCAQPTPPTSLDGVCEKLLKLLDVGEEGIKPNVIAALSAAMEISEQFCKDAIKGQTAQKLVPLLTAPAASAAAVEESGPVRQAVMNSITCIGALAESTEEGLQSVLDAGAVPAVLTFCNPDIALLVQEAAADTMCKIMSGSAAAKETAEKAGAVSALAKLLSSDIKNADVTVRALLGLGMLMPVSSAAQLELAKNSAAVGALLALMRQGDDGDCQHIAAGLFQGLAGAEGAKEALTESMRTAQQEAEKNVKYVS